jgi:hypothetical protein
VTRGESQTWQGGRVGHGKGGESDMVLRLRWPLLRGGLREYCNVSYLFPRCDCYPQDIQSNLKYIMVLSYERAGAM